MKRWLLILLTAIGVLLLIVALFALRFSRMTRTVRAAPIADVDVRTVADGTYEGEFGDFLVRVKVRVTVRGGRMETVEITEQHAGPGYEAKETVERILAAQSPRVDAVTGATGSSRCIMVAVARALASAPRLGSP